MALPNPQPFVETDHPPHLRPFAGTMPGHAKYPPVVAKVEMLGYIEDTNATSYSRDIGRSSILKGNVYYMFGDTFCKNQQGAFVGVQSTTSSIINKPSQPLSSTYLTIQEDGVVDALVPLTEAEHRQEKIIWKDKTHPRVTLWAFGGMVEVGEYGYLWFQKGVINETEGNEENVYKGTGLARVKAEKDGRLNTYRANGPLIFSADEPRIGTLSTIVEGDFVYLWGDHAKGYGDGIILSRVSKDMLEYKDCYTYWNGDSYVADWKEAQPVFNKMQSGAVVRTCLFGEEMPWLFVGSTGWADSKVMLGASATLEGPFNEKPIFMAEGLDQPDTIMYCMYPHTWAFDGHKGELMVTWSEQWPGGVVGTKNQGVFALKFNLQLDGGKYFARIPLADYSMAVQSTIVSEMTQSLNRYYIGGTTVELEGRYVTPGFAPPPDVMGRVLRLEAKEVNDLALAASLVRRRLDGMKRGKEGGDRRRKGGLARFFWSLVGK